MNDERTTADTTQEAGKLVRDLRADIRGRLEALATNVDRTAADAGFRHLLSGMAQLWRYSVFNQVWIASQRRDATAVAGRRQWEAKGRTVRDGEKPISILAPSRPGRGGWPFLLVEVFDISQTDGPPPPAIADFNPTKGECPDLPRIEAATERLKIELETIDPRLHVDIAGNVPNFAGRALGGKVQVVVGLSPLARASTLAHEYAHELLHEPGKNPHPPPHSVRETEAEATAFVVMAALGYEVRAPTYIAWQGGKGQTILRSMHRIAAAANAILTAVEGEKPKLRIPPLEPRRKVSRGGSENRRTEMSERTDLSPRLPRRTWREGPIDNAREHIEILYGDFWKDGNEGLVPIARVAPAGEPKAFTVEIDPSAQNAEMADALAAVTRELD